ncbi:MAG: 2-dehydropantoate 2-reductase [Kofleriaceae bacterium]
MSQPHVVVLGAGLVGGYLGGALAAGGARVTLLGRAQVLEPVAQGMFLTDLDGLQVRVAPERYRIATHPVCLAEADIVLLCVKSTATESAGSDLARFARPGTSVLCFQNGVRAADLLVDLVPHCQVISGMVPFNVVRLAPTHWHRASEGVLYASPHPSADLLRPFLAACNLPMVLHPDLRTLLWSKVLLNLNNAINALSGAPLRQQLQDRGHRLVLAACVDEALTAIRSSGIEPAPLGNIKPDEISKVLRLPTFLYSLLAMRKLKIDERARSSMAEDLANGRRTEIEELNGAVVALAATRGLPVPVNQRIFELVRAAEAGDPRRYTGAQLRALTGV